MVDESACRLPTPTGPNRYARLAERPGQSPVVHAELLCHERERCAFLVACRSSGNRVVSHLADYLPPSNACSTKVANADDRRSVHLVPKSERIDRLTLAVAVDQLVDLNLRQSVLDRV